MTGGCPAPDTLSILVVDDEAPARRKLIRTLGDMEGVAVVGEASSGLEAVERIGTLTPDLVLLDIQMPQLDGFGVIEAVGVDVMPAVVFVTAYDEHALRAFDVRALDYLLKPVMAGRLRDAVERVQVRRRLAGVDASAAAGDSVRQREQLGDMVAERGRALRRVLVHDERGARLLSMDSVELARAERNYVVLHTTEGKFRVRGTIGGLLERMNPELFLQVNRSDVIRFDAIRDLQPWSHGDYRVVLRGGQAMLWSRRFRARDAGRFALGG